MARAQKQGSKRTKETREPVKRRVFIRAAAKRDLLRHAFYIADNSPQAAARFLDAARDTFEQLLRFPTLGSSHDPMVSRLEGIRRFRVKGFEDYLVFYRPTQTGIDVVRLIHGARDIGAAFAQ